MVYAVQANLWFTTQARRDAYVTKVSAWLNLSRWRARATDISSLSDPGNPYGQWRVIIEIRFTTRNDQQSVWNEILADTGTATRGISRWELNRHECFADENPPAPCVPELTSAGP